jgi:hypothetical protein
VHGECDVDGNRGWWCGDFDAGSGGIVFCVGYGGECADVVDGVVRVGDGNGASFVRWRWWCSRDNHNNYDNYNNHHHNHDVNYDLNYRRAHHDDGRRASDYDFASRSTYHHFDINPPSNHDVDGCGANSHHRLTAANSY